MINCKSCTYYTTNKLEYIEDEYNGMCQLGFCGVNESEKCVDYEERQLYKGDCLQVMDKLIEKEIKVDMILVDPPYGKIRGRWDVIIPLEAMWKRINKLIKDNGAVIIFGNEPYSSKVRLSNEEMYKYDWKWVKNRATGFANCNYRPMSRYEDIMVFSKANASVGGKKNAMVYIPQGLKVINKIKKNTDKRQGLIQQDTNNLGENNSLRQGTTYTQKFTNYPDNILEFDCESKYVHPTQKPTKLLEFLINTYSEEGQTVLDFTMGSGSTGIACRNTNRRFIGIELEEKYFNIAEDRIIHKLS